MRNKFNPDKKILLDANYVFIDGLSRSGKAGISPLVCSLSKVEHHRQNFNFDRLGPLLETGHLSKEGFKYFFESDLLIDSWFMMMGRNMNMNEHDNSSVLNSKKKDEYINRLKTKDNPEIFEELKNKIKKEQLIFPYLTEDMFLLASENSKIFENKKIKLILTMRHPIETIFSWHRSKRGSRLGVDQRMPHPTFNHDNYKHIPSFALARAEEYSSEDALGKCVIAMTTLTNSYIRALISSDIRSKINFIKFDFDSFTINPQKGIDKITDFLATKRTDFTATALKMARMPREAKHDLFYSKACAIFANTSKHLHDEIIESCKQYENLFQECPYKLPDISDLDLSFYKKIDFSELTPQPAFINGYRQN